MYLAVEIIIIVANISHTVMVKIDIRVLNVIIQLEVPCLRSWVTTGILSYRLLVKNFKCYYLRKIKDEKKEEL